ncbi:MAG: Crp/Fnr family transcriptional regulator [Bacilli bacterium]|jgi:CRP-like cAMP-binding protein|nr:Crp/Fnr family transcriptional regulator [Bacilli bacterium]
MKNLVNNDLFKNIKDDDIDNIIKEFKLEKYDKNKLIFMEKDIIDRFFIIEQGKIEISKFDIDGKKNIVTILNTQDMFAESIALAMTNISPYTITTLEKSNIYHIEVKNYLNLITKYPILAINMNKILAIKNTFLTFKIDCLSKRSIKDKVHELLRYYAIINDSFEIALPFNKTNLADFLCVDRSALSRVLTKMIDDNIFSYHHNKYYLNKEFFKM